MDESLKWPPWVMEEFASSCVSRIIRYEELSVSAKIVSGLVLHAELSDVT